MLVLAAEEMANDCLDMDAFPGSLQYFCVVLCLLITVLLTTLPTSQTLTCDEPELSHLKSVGSIIGCLCPFDWGSFCRSLMVN